MSTAHLNGVADNPNVRKKVSANGYEFEIDGSNRTHKVTGDLRINVTQRRSRTSQQNAGKPDRLSTDHGGHIIGREFGGPEIPENHFAQDANFNKSEYRKLEIKWRKLRETGKRILVSILPVYVGQSKRPTNIYVTYTIGKEVHFRSFPNLPKGK